MGSRRLTISSLLNDGAEPGSPQAGQSVSPPSSAARPQAQDVYTQQNSHIHDHDYPGPSLSPHYPRPDAERGILPNHLRESGSRRSFSGERSDGSPPPRASSHGRTSYIAESPVRPDFLPSPSSASFLHQSSPGYDWEQARRSRGSLSSLLQQSPPQQTAPLRSPGYHPSHAYAMPPPPSPRLQSPMASPYSLPSPHIGSYMPPPRSPVTAFAPLSASVSAQRASLSPIFQRPPSQPFNRPSPSSSHGPSPRSLSMDLPPFSHQDPYHTQQPHVPMRSPSNHFTRLPPLATSLPPQSPSQPSPFQGLDALVEAASVEREREKRRRVSLDSEPEGIHDRFGLQPAAREARPSLELEHDPNRFGGAMTSNLRGYPPAVGDLRGPGYSGETEASRRRSSGGSSSSLHSLLHASPAPEPPRRLYERSPSIHDDRRTVSPSVSREPYTEPLSRQPDLPMQRPDSPPRRPSPVMQQAVYVEPPEPPTKQEQLEPQAIDEPPPREPSPIVEDPEPPQARSSPEGTIDDMVQDADEWLLEQLASPRGSPPASSPPSPRSSRPPSVSSHMPKREETPAFAVPRAQSRQSSARISTPGVGIDDELAAAVDDPAPAGDVQMDVDVDDELLSLLDDRPRGRSKASSKKKKKPASTSWSPAPASDRASMPPPVAGPSVPANEASTSTASQKKKGTKQPKPKAPPKPRAKAPAKPKAAKAKAGAAAATPDAGFTLADIAPGLTTTGRTKKVPVFRSPDAAMPLTSRRPAALAVTAVKNASKQTESSRSRSTSVMPPAPTPALAPEPVHEPEPQDVGSEDEAVDEKLYCICKTQYDEDKVMIACDRCDEWYHTQCLKMAELEVDLVDQFICPICVQKNPHLSLQTTWKQRCAYGLQHADPASRAACHKPARGLYSKYCSDECGVKLMQARIQRWVHQGGSKDGLWEAVKHAQRREGVTLAVEPVKVEPEVKMEIDGAAPDADAKPKIDMGIQPKSATEREVERLRRQLDTLSKQHEEIQKSMDFIAWNERLLDLADRRSEAVGECGWDQRLCFGDSEWAEFGVGVLESYDTEGERQGMNGDAEHTPGLEGEWWCRGKTKCERHAGWQKLRFSEVALDKEIKEVALGKLTTREREIRKRIEDLLDPHAIPLAVPPRRSVAPSQPRPPPIELANGHVKTKANGQPTKRGKKRKAD